MYYVMSYRYVGPNDYADSDVVEIRTSRGDAASSVDWAVRRSGTYVSVEEAREAIFAEFGRVRNCEDELDFNQVDSDVVESYRPSEFPLLSKFQTCVVFEGDVEENVAANTTDEQISELVSIFSEEIKGRGLVANSDALREMMEAHREEQRRNPA